MLTYRVKGNFNNTERFFDRYRTQLPLKIRRILERYGQAGVEALKFATPRDTGETANSWFYEIHKWGISWNNSNVISNGMPLAILIQYGHGTRGGAYIQGIDYINPAMKPIFEKIRDDIWKEVENL
jgi:hypothetical protein